MDYSSSVLKVAEKIDIDRGCFLITGATGLIGHSIIDVLQCANAHGANFEIYALGRSLDRIQKLFGEKVHPVVQDITSEMNIDASFDYIIHAASNADPVSYSKYPVETILTNIYGNRNVLEYCRKHKNCRMIMTSSFEVYGMIENQDIYSENSFGFLSMDRLRNGYPESKRCSELLLRSYVDEYSVDALIARLSSVYGPTMNLSDSKAHAQFIRNGLDKKDIVLKSEGLVTRSYTYVLDAVSAIFKVLQCGRAGEAYNVSNENSIASIREVAECVADIAGVNVVFDLPSEFEKKGFSMPQNCILDNSRLKALGWSGDFSLREGIIQTIETMSAFRKRG